MIPGALYRYVALPFFVVSDNRIVVSFQMQSYVQESTIYYLVIINDGIKIVHVFSGGGMNCVSYVRVPRTYVLRIIIKIKIHSSSCEIEYFVETHLCKLCVILLRSRVLRVVCPH